MSRAKESRRQESRCHFRSYNRRWRVYDREGEPCPKCKDLIRRVTHAGRSTYFCGRCQLV